MRQSREIMVLALGGEGTPSEVGAIQCNLPHILSPDFVCSDGGGNLTRLREAGTVVVAGSANLPFRPHSFDRIIAHSTPVCGTCRDLAKGTFCGKPPQSFAGATYCWVQIRLLLKPVVFLT